MNKKELKEIVNTGEQYVEYYKTGFLDGVNSTRIRKIKWANIQEKCKIAFEKRFVTFEDKGGKNGTIKWKTEKLC